MINPKVKELLEALNKAGFKPEAIPPLTLEDIKKWDQVNKEVTAFLESKEKAQKESEHAFDGVQFKGQ